MAVSTGLWMDRKVTRNGMKENNGLRVQRKGQDLVVGFLPSLIVFILKMIPNSWASDRLACVPWAAQGGGKPRTWQGSCKARAPHVSSARGWGEGL